MAVRHSREARSCLAALRTTVQPRSTNALTNGVTSQITAGTKHHCWRNATVGSMRVARRAGM